VLITKTNSLFSGKNGGEADVKYLESVLFARKEEPYSTKAIVKASGECVLLRYAQLGGGHLCMLCDLRGIADD